jgi:hypothetical protein
MTEAKATTSKFLMDLPYGRYSLYEIAIQWADVLQHSDDTRHLGHSELVKKALEDIVNGVISEDDVLKAKKEKDSRMAAAAAGQQAAAPEKEKEKKAE